MYILPRVSTLSILSVNTVQCVISKTMMLLKSDCNAVPDLLTKFKCNSARSLMTHVRSTYVIVAYVAYAVFGLVTILQTCVPSTGCFGMCRGTHARLDTWLRRSVSQHICLSSPISQYNRKWLWMLVPCSAVLYFLNTSGGWCPSGSRAVLY